MNLISDLFKGMLMLSFVALVQHGCSVKNMASYAVKAHQKGLTSYGAYSRALTGQNDSWAKRK